jgi:hypothetical protein
MLSIVRGEVRQVDFFDIALLVERKGGDLSHEGESMSRL